MFKLIKKILPLKKLSEKCCEEQYFEHREVEKTFRPKCFQIKKKMK